MDSHKIAAYLSIGFLFIVGSTIVAVFLAATYPLEPKIIDINLPLQIRNPQVKADDYLTYETTYTQYRELEATVITYLIPVDQPDEHIELSRTRTKLPQAINQRVKNNIFIPPGTMPGEYMIHIHVNYEWNAFRTVPVHLGSDQFSVLNEDGTKRPVPAIEQPTIGKSDVSPHILQGQTPAIIRVEGNATVQIKGDPSPKPTPTPHENYATPTPTPTLTPTPAPTPNPTPGQVCIFNVCVPSL